jgi:SAM-dependent methyltransferase
MKKDQLVLFFNVKQESKILEDYIKRKARIGQTLQILEAGCGRKWPLKLDGISYKIQGIDADKEALEIRKNVAKDLDEFIVGDLTKIDLPPCQYDVIYSSFVMEHIQNAEEVLEKFAKWLTPNGLLILRIPDRYSVYGFITRTTPHWVHVLYKKYIEGMPNAGKPGYDPYPTFHDEVISRNGVRDFCKKNGLVLQEEYGHGYYLKRGKGMIPLLKRIFVYGVYGISLGNLAFRHNNLTYVLEKSS